MRAILCLLALALAPGILAEDSPDALLEAGHVRRARPLIEARLKTNPNDAQANYLMARVQQAFGEIDKALQHAEKAVQLDSKNAEYHMRLSEIVGTAAERASALKQFGLGRRCKKEFETALALNPKHVDALALSILYYWQAPGMLGGDKNKARAAVEEIARIDPSRGYLERINLMRRAKEDANFEELYQKAVEANPASYRAQAALANFYLYDSKKRYELAEKPARAARKLDPGRIPAYTLLALLACVQQKWTEMEVVLAEAERHVPDNLVPYYFVGNLLLRDNKDLPRAEACFRKYLSQEAEGGAPAHAFAKWRLALVLEKQGRKNDAVTELEAALRLRPDDDAIRKDLRRLK